MNLIQKKFMKKIKTKFRSNWKKINDAYTYVNCLQTELEACTAEFNAQMTAAKVELVALRKRIGAKRIEKAAPYYRQLAERARAQDLAADAARQYQRSLSELQAARETLEVAENAQKPSVQTDAAGAAAACLDEAAASWEEHLSLARQRVVYAEQELERCRYEHQLHSKQYSKASEQLASLKAKQERLIESCRPFYELKMARERTLTELEDRRQQLTERLGGQKRAHKQAMSSLEAISSDMHMRRLQQQVSPADHVSISLTADAESMRSDCSEESRQLTLPPAAPSSASVPPSPARGRIVSRLGHVTEHPLLQSVSGLSASSSSKSSNAAAATAAAAPPSSPTPADA
uniref:SH3 domain-binding protein 5-like n=1 Tax=Macrostomum lignano TaxID=282301 RepID=A0A1I8G186_9PLAT